MDTTTVVRKVILAMDRRMQGIPFYTGKYTSPLLI
jgi:hypothetical protein